MDEALAIRARMTKSTRTSVTSGDDSTETRVLMHSVPATTIFQPASIFGTTATVLTVAAVSLPVLGAVANGVSLAASGYGFALAATNTLGFLVQLGIVVAAPAFLVVLFFWVFRGLPHSLHALDLARAQTGQVRDLLDQRQADIDESSVAIMRDVAEMEAVSARLEALFVGDVDLVDSIELLQLRDRALLYGTR